MPVATKRNTIAVFTVGTIKTLKPRPINTEAQMTKQEIESRLAKVEEKAEKAIAESTMCRQLIKSLLNQNAEYREKLIECGYLV